MDREVKIKLSTLNIIGEYLASKPYFEVVDLIHLLKTGIKELPPQETTDDKPKNQTKTEQKNFGKS